MEFEFWVKEGLKKVTLERKEDRYIFSDGQTSFEADVRYISPHQLSVLVHGRSHQVFLAREGENRFVCVDGQEFCIREPSEDREEFKRGEERTPEGMLLVKAPMPGKVIKVNVGENESVRKNQTLAIVEAMKMENEIKASVEARVKKIHIREGDLVDSDKPLIELEPASTSS